MSDRLQNVWPEWQVVRQIGQGSYGVIYEVERTDHAIHSRAAVKVISIPQNRSELDSLRAEGMSGEASRSYLQKVVNDFVGEIQIMESFKGTQNIVSVEDYKVVEKTDTVGWDIYIRMELLTPLNDYFDNRTPSEYEVIKLGIDLCNALELCEKQNVIHRDIKPENIFINKFDNFKLGDFGIARRLENVSGSLSQKGTYSYMAPEVARGGAYDATVDIYSLGLVLYRFMNQKRLPFLSASEMLDPNARTEANQRRIAGEPLPRPCDASPAFAELILCACAFDPKQRFASAKVMKNALASVARQSRTVSEGTVSVRKPQPSGPVETGPVGPGPQKNQEPEKSQGPRGGWDEFPDPVDRFGDEKRRPSGAVIAVCVVLALALALGGVLFMERFLGKEEDSSAAGESEQLPADNSPDISESPSAGPGGTGSAAQVDEIVRDAEAAAAVGDFAGAVTIVDNGLAQMPDNQQLQARRETYARLLQEKQALLDQAAQLQAEGDYVNAVQMLEDAAEDSPADGDYRSAYEAACESCKAQALAEAQALADQGQYGDALDTLALAEAVIGEDAELSQAMHTYEDAWASGVELPYVNARSSGRYEDCLEPELYLSWTYDDRMEFAYPGSLYQQVSADNAATATLDGENEITYTFTSDKLPYVTLTYQKVRCTPGLPEEAICRDWHDSRMNSFVEFYEILYKDQGPAPRYVVTGYGDSSKSWTLYEVVEVTGSYLYRMTVTMPTPVTDQEDQQRSYITECLYRCCKFSGGAGPCRSYEEFVG